jgi:hypothetical protein
MKKSSVLFYRWFFLNAILFLSHNILTGLLFARGVKDPDNLIGLISGGLTGLLIGVVQWFILRQYFSMSPLWILSCLIGFALYYAVNWYLGSILLGIFGQFLLRSQTKDAFLWFAASIIGLGISGLLLFKPETLFLSSAVYGLPTGILLAWYQDRLQSPQK